jgi:uncharacterized protein (UPF0147 family)
MAGKFEKVEGLIKYLQEDIGTPRSVREKLGRITQYLKQPVDDSTKISTILSDIEELCMDVNIPPYVRTQLYSISSQLESISNE